jgi:dihydroxyacetone kinase
MAAAAAMEPTAAVASAAAPATAAMAASTAPAMAATATAMAAAAMLGERDRGQGRSGENGANRHASARERPTASGCALIDV